MTDYIAIENFYSYISKFCAVDFGNNRDYFISQLASWCIQNDANWKNLTEMNLEKCSEKYIVMENGSFFNFEHILNSIPKNEHGVFWTRVCEIINRNETSFAAQVADNVRISIEKFIGDMASYNNSLTVDFVTKFVLENVQAIRVRSFENLTCLLGNIAECDADYFWDHLSSIYNAMFPFEKMEPPNVISTLVNSLSNVSESETFDIEQILKQIINPKTIGGLLKMIQEPDGLSTILAGLTPKQ
jgi:hypothetical protein